MFLTNLYIVDYTLKFSTTSFVGTDIFYMFLFKVDELYSSIFASIGLSNARMINIHMAYFATLKNRASKIFR